VQEIGHLRQEVDQLKDELANVKDSKTSSPSVDTVNHIGSTVAGNATGKSAEGNDRQMGTYVQVAQELQCIVGAD